MPPQLLDKFPEREPKAQRFASLFDGQSWKVDPTEYDYNVGEIKLFVNALKSAAHAQHVYIRTFITIDDHVILQRRPLDYKPAQKGGFHKKKTTAPTSGTNNP